jgi:uncharacterized repeat protein (TIGR01451 family)
VYTKIGRFPVKVFIYSLILILIMLIPAAFAEAATDHQTWDNLTKSWRQDKLKGYKTEDFVPHHYIFGASALDSFGANDIIFRFEGDHLQNANPNGYVDARHFFIVEANFTPDGVPPFGPPANPVFSESDDVYEVTEGVAGDKYFVQFKVTDKAALIAELNGGQLAFYWEYQLSEDADLWTGNLQSKVNIPGVGAQTVNFNAKRDIVQDEPSIHVSKTALPTTYSSAGDLITYTIEVTNNGNVALSDVVVTDDLLEDLELNGSLIINGAIGSLDPSESKTVTGTYTITQEDLDVGSVDNEATATGKPPEGNNVSASDDETVTAVQNAKIELIKTATPKIYTAAGQIINYSFTVTNTGNVTLTNIMVTDPKVTVVGGPIASLAPDATNSTTFTATYTIIQADLSAGEVENTATVTGSPPVGEDVTDTDTETVEYRRVPDDYVPPTFSPSITVKKYVSIEGGSWLDAETAPGPPAVVGSMVRFRFVVTNSGNVTLSGITLTDNKFNLPGLFIPASLAPGGSFEYILTGIPALAGQHSNTATATGVYGQQVVSDTDKGHYFGSVTVTPSISVKKHVSVDKGATWYDAETIAAGPDAVAGARVKFRFKVTNTGNATLTNITLADSEYSLSGVTVPATLAPGASFEGTIEVTAVKGRHVNTATATGRHEGQTYSDTDKANYYGYVPYTPPVTPDPVEPTPEPEEPKPKPTPPTDGAYTSGLYYALVLFALAAIALKKGFPQGLALRLSKKR